MAKTKISEYSATANSNTDVASINIDEGCAPSGINNAIRAIMGHLKDFQSGTSNDPFTIGSSGSLTLSYGTAYSVQYLNATKVVTSDANFVYTTTGLGIGTSSPTAKLQVYGPSSGTVANIGYNGDAGTGLYVNVNHASNLVQLYASGSANKSMVFYTGSTEVMRYDTSGNLGLGVTPSLWGSSANLQFPLGSLSSSAALGTALSLNAYNNAGWKYQFSNTLALLYQQGGSGHAWYTAPSWDGTGSNAISFTQAMTLDASGNLGVGTTSPSTGGRFVVYGKVSYAGQNQVALFYSQASGGAVINFQDTASANGSAIGGTGDNLTFYTSSGGGNLTERARIDSGGTFRVKGAGTAGSTDAVQFSGSAPASALSLDSSGNLLVGTTSGGRLTAQSADTSSSSYGLFITDSSSTLMIGTRNDGYLRAPIVYSATSASAANITVDSSGYIYRSTSALKYKTDIRDLEPVNLDSLRPVRYKSLCGNDDKDSDFIGFVADEAADNGWEELVSRNAAGEIEGFQYERVTALLWKKAQEQQSIIQSLTDRITALEGAKA